MHIVETLFNGRPSEPRSEREDRCYDLLDSLSVEFFRVDHEHADTIPDCELVEDLRAALQSSDARCLALQVRPQPGRKGVGG